MVIFVDMDEVIADTYGAHIEWYNRDFKQDLKLADCNGREAWDNVLPEHRETVRRHAHTVGFFADLKPIKDSQEVLRELSKQHEVYIASAAMEFPNSLKEKSDWLDIHFPFIHWRKRILLGDKNILKGDVLIDDRTINLEHFDGRRIMFTSPHNTNVESFERADSWKEVAQLLS